VFGCAAARLSEGVVLENDSAAIARLRCEDNLGWVEVVRELEILCVETTVPLQTAGPGPSVSVERERSDHARQRARARYVTIRAEAQSQGGESGDGEAEAC
jgi:hypothetical protein